MRRRRLAATFTLLACGAARVPSASAAQPSYVARPECPRHHARRDASASAAAASSPLAVQLLGYQLKMRSAGSGYECVKPQGTHRCVWPARLATVTGSHSLVTGPIRRFTN